MARLDPRDEAPRPIEYPESDGEPIGETDEHITAILYLRQALRQVFRSLPDIYVAANMLFYFEEGEPASRKAPDVFVVKGVPKHNRRTFKLWEEKKAPCLIVEVTSRSSRWEDVATKSGLYAFLGVSEYLIFDPLSEYLEPRFRALELRDGSYHPVTLEEGDRFTSRVLDVAFQPEGSLLRVIDGATGLSVLDLDELQDQAMAEARRAAQAEDRATRAQDRATQAEDRATQAEDRATQAEIELQRYRERFGKIEE